MSISNYTPHDFGLVCAYDVLIKSMGPNATGMSRGECEFVFTTKGLDR